MNFSILNDKGTMPISDELGRWLFIRCFKDDHALFQSFISQGDVGVKLENGWILKHHKT